LVKERAQISVFTVSAVIGDIGTSGFKRTVVGCTDIAVITCFAFAFALTVGTGIVDGTFIDIVTFRSIEGGVVSIAISSVGVAAVYSTAFIVVTALLCARFALPQRALIAYCAELSIITLRAVLRGENTASLGAAAVYSA